MVSGYEGVVRGRHQQIYTSGGLPSMASFTKGTNRGNKSGQQFQGPRTTVAIVGFMEENIIVPDHDITRHPIWLDHQYFRFITDRSPDFQNALKINRTILSNMVLDDLREYIRHKNVYYYPPKETVLTLDESYNLIRLILTQQMTAYQLSEFLHNRYLMLNNKSGKHNCILIKGVPSVGKTWFANLLGKLMINTGYIGNSNRYNQFPFQDCPRRNLLIFDEPNVEPSSYENFKLLFAGTPLSANIKYESRNLVNRTPVIICCNSDPFPHNPEFNSRIYRYTWNTRIDSILTNIKGHPHPDGLYRLLLQYNTLSTLPPTGMLQNNVPVEEYREADTYMQAILEEDATSLLTTFIPDTPNDMEIEFERLQRSHNNMDAWDI
nr:uncharacterized protein LOC106687706 [Halyomorpha halys]